MSNGQIVVKKERKNAPKKLVAPKPFVPKTEPLSPAKAIKRENASPSKGNSPKRARSSYAFFISDQMKNEDGTDNRTKMTRANERWKEVRTRSREQKSGRSQNISSSEILKVKTEPGSDIKSEPVSGSPEEVLKAQTLERRPNTRSKTRLSHAYQAEVKSEPLASSLNEVSKTELQDRRPSTRSKTQLPYAENVLKVDPKIESDELGPKNATSLEEL